MAQKFELRLTSKNRKRLIEDIEDEFRDLHDKDSRTADVELALEKALKWKRMRREKKQEIEAEQKELDKKKEKWDLSD